MSTQNRRPVVNNPQAAAKTQGPRQGPKQSPKQGQQGGQQRKTPIRRQIPESAAEVETEIVMENEQINEQTNQPQTTNKPRGGQKGKQAANQQQGQQEQQGQSQNQAQGPKIKRTPKPKIQQAPTPCAGIEEYIAIFSGGNLKTSEFIIVNDKSNPNTYLNYYNKLKAFYDCKFDDTKKLKCDYVIIHNYTDNIMNAFKQFCDEKQDNLSDQIYYYDVKPEDTTDELLSNIHLVHAKNITYLRNKFKTIIETTYGIVNPAFSTHSDRTKISKPRAPKKPKTNNGNTTNIQQSTIIKNDENVEENPTVDVVVDDNAVDSDEVDQFPDSVEVDENGNQITVDEDGNQIVVDEDGNPITDDDNEEVQIEQDQ